MTDDALGDRGKALENAFFKAEELNRIEKLKESADRSKKIDSLRSASGIKNIELLEHLLDLNLTSDTLAAVSLVPLIHVAWADGDVDDKEKDAILKSASEKGVDKSTDAYELLGNWLTKEPGNIFDIWKEYVSELISGWNDTKKEELGRDVLERAKEIAEAAGGIMGIGATSKEEAHALNQIKSVFGLE